MRASACVRLKFSSRRNLETVFEAVKPELHKQATSRSKTTLEKDTSSLTLKIEAQDTIALRAALNSYLRWINSVIEVLQIVNERSPK